MPSNRRLDRSTHATDLQCTAPDASHRRPPPGAIAQARQNTLGKAHVRRNREALSVGRGIPPVIFLSRLLKAPLPKPHALVPASAPAHLPPANPAVRQALCRVRARLRVDKSSRAK